MQHTYVIIDLETTGHSPKNGDSILEIGLVVMRGGKVEYTFESLVNPQGEIPSYIQTLTGITPEMVQGAPQIEEVLPTVLKALDQGIFVAHHASFDWTFLQETLEIHGYSPLTNPILDTVELARTFLPTLPSYSLGYLTETLGISHLQPHRALSDAEATAILLHRLLQHLEELPLPIIQQLQAVAPYLQSDWPLLINNQLVKKGNWQRSEQFREQYGEYRGVIWRRAGEGSAALSNASWQASQDVETTIGCYFDPTKPYSFPAQMQGYEVREQQQAMMEAVQAALNQGKHLLVEAGTGMGKTLGYALPSILWALHEGKRVIWSTQTLQLQDQILYHEIPLLRRVLPYPFRVTLRKGIQQYLCFEQFFRWMENEPYTYDEALAQAQLLIWLYSTETGDLSELNLPSHGKTLLPQLTCTSSDCLGASCPWAEHCYYQRAKQDAHQAQIVIVNHALLAQELQQEEGILPSYEALVIDEAHQFVETLAQHWTEEVSTELVHPLMNKMISGKLWDWIAFSTGAPASCEEFRRLALQWLNIYQDWEEEVLSLYGKRGKQEESSFIRYEREQFTEGGPLLQATARLYTAWQALNQHMMETSAVGESQKHLERLWRDFQQFASALPQLLIANEAQLERDAEGENEGEPYQYWITYESLSSRSFTLLAIPTHVAQQLNERLFKVKESVILTSATLTVNGSFQYIRRLLGLHEESDTEQVREAIFPSPYQYDQQMKIVVPEQIPLLHGEGDAQFIEHVAQSLAQVVKEAGGGCLVLFTAKEMLLRIRERLVELLEGTRIQVLAQGVDSNNRTRLAQRFQAEGASVLLGTASFWEGVDIPGDALRLLAIVRLPFVHPEDPYYRTRIVSLGLKPQEGFFRLALPQTILRLRQGMGRLIRSTKDRGMVILYDRRIITGRYGKQILRALPGAPFYEVSQEELIHEIQTWFHG